MSTLLSKDIKNSNKSLKVVLMTRDGDILVKLSDDGMAITLPGTIHGASEEMYEKVMELEMMFRDEFGILMSTPWFVVDNKFVTKGKTHEEQFFVYATSSEQLELISNKPGWMVINNQNPGTSLKMAPVLERALLRSPFLVSAVRKL
jgi:hypothetical protein